MGVPPSFVGGVHDTDAEASWATAVTDEGDEGVPTGVSPAANWLGTASTGLLEAQHWDVPSVFSAHTPASPVSIWEIPLTAGPVKAGGAVLPQQVNSPDEVRAQALCQPTLTFTTFESPTGTVVTSWKPPVDVQHWT